MQFYKNIPVFLTVSNIAKCHIIFITGMEFGLSTKARNFAGNKTGLDKDEAIRVGYSKKVFYSSYHLLNINKEEKIKEHIFDELYMKETRNPYKISLGILKNYFFLR